MKCYIIEEQWERPHADNKLVLLGKPQFQIIAITSIANGGCYDLPISIEPAMQKNTELSTQLLQKNGAPTWLQHG